MAQGHIQHSSFSFHPILFQNIADMNENILEENKIESLPITNIVEDSIASRTKEITKRPKRERSPSKE